MDNRIILSEEEIVSTLQKTNIPTIVIEGKSDIVFYRRLERDLQDLSISLLPVGGRNTALKLFERRSEFLNSTKIMFLLDRDTWIYTGVPKIYVNDIILLSNGYSIENDAFIDGNIFDLMTGPEQDVFNDEINIFLKWYQIKIFEFMNDNSVKFSNHPREIIENQIYAQLTPLDLDNCSDKKEILVKIILEYQQYLRGKSLLQIAVRRFSHPKRATKHSLNALIEIGALACGAIYKERMSEISKILSNTINNSS